MRSYGQNTKIGRNWVSRTGCTGTPLKCTDTLWPLVGCIGTLLFMYRYTFRNFPRKCIFSPFFHIFDTQFNSILHIHLKTISYSFCNLFSIQFLFQYLSLLQKSIMNYSQITLIWVMAPTQTKYKDLLGFVLTQLFYLAINP